MNHVRLDGGETTSPVRHAIEKRLAGLGTRVKTTNDALEQRIRASTILDVRDALRRRDYEKASQLVDELEQRMEVKIPVS